MAFLINQASDGAAVSQDVKNRMLLVSIILPLVVSVLVFAYDSERTWETYEGLKKQIKQRAAAQAKFNAGKSAMRSLAKVQLGVKAFQMGQKWKLKAQARVVAGNSNSVAGQQPGVAEGQVGHARSNTDSQYHNTDPGITNESPQLSIHSVDTEESEVEGEVASKAE